MAGNFVTVRFPRAVDVHSAHSLRCRLLDAVRSRPSRLILDMSGVESFDTTAAAVLVGVRRRLRHLGGRVEMVNVDPAVAARLRQLGLARFSVG
jgi:anti-anti-sigma factor